jgi:TolB protein
MSQRSWCVLVVVGICFGTGCGSASPADAGDANEPDSTHDAGADASDAITSLDASPDALASDAGDATTDASTDTTVVMPSGYPSNWLAFATKRTGEYDIFLVQSDNTSLTRLTYDPAIDVFPSWSPDGLRLAFASNRTGNFELYIHNFTDGSVHVIDTSVLARATTPAFSPDGTTLAFEGKIDMGTAPDIFTIAVAGGTPHRLTTAGANDSGPVWSPDASTIYFVSDRGGMYDIWAMAADGTNQRAITTNAGVLGKPAISPDGATLAYARIVSGTLSGIVLRTIASGSEHVLTMQNDSEPAWRRDGTQLAITSLRSGNPDILVIDASTGAVVLSIAPDPALDGTATWSPRP